MGNLLKNKWLWLVGGFILLIIIIAITGGSEEKTVSESTQSQNFQEQSGIKELGSDKFRAKTFMCANFCARPNAIISVEKWSVLKDCMEECLFSDSSISQQIEGILEQSSSAKIEEILLNHMPPELFMKIMDEVGVKINETTKSEILERQVKLQQKQQIQKETQERVQKGESCSCVYRNCNDESSCEDFCQRKGYSKCGGNACWEQDPGYNAIKYLMKYSSENYCQCSNKLKGVKYEDEIPYGQCYSTGSCDLVCSWINQTCLKAGCSCCN